MKVLVEDRSFDDPSRGLRKIKAWRAMIQLEGVTIFERDYQQFIAHQPGYHNRGERVKDAKSVKTAVVKDFVDALINSGVK